MTTGRINQVTGLGLDHDSTRPCGMRVPGLPRSCKKQLSSITKKGRSRRMPSHTSNANPGKLKPKLQRTGKHTSVCIRSIAAHVNRSNSVRIRLQIRDRSAGGAQKHTNRSPPQPGHRLSGTRPQQRPELSTAARHVGSVTRRHRNSHTKQRRVRRTSFYTCLPNPYTPKKLRRARGPPTLR